MKLFKLSILAAALVGTLVACNKNDAFMGDSLPLTATDAANAAGTMTAQGISVNFNDYEEYTVTDNIIYKFNKKTAGNSEYVVKTLSSVVPKVEKKSGKDNCSAPSAPAVPSVPELVLEKYANDNRCVFFNGGSAPAISVEVKETKESGSGSSKCVYEYTWTYTVQAVNVPAETGWSKTENLGQLPVITIAPSIAGLSVVSNKTHPHKASFALLNSDGTSRISNLVINVNGVQYPVNHSVVAGEDFNYASNGGQFGDPELLKIVNEKFEGRTAFQILLNDLFDGNNDASNAVQAKLEPIQVQLVKGVNNITVTGIVKGNATLGSADQTINVNYQKIVSAENCK